MKIEDKVHGEIQLPKYADEIILTKEFQRLRNIKQLGVSHYYFKHANHTRYEHSIGTAYLCNKILDVIERNTDIRINENHKKCVVLAGLLHDIGHGPYSHLWENVVRKGTHKDWTHEDQSVLMIKFMIRNNNIALHPDPEIHGEMIELTCSLITGDFSVWNRILQPSEMFITEVVSNKFCNLDVDKSDYLLRDFKWVGYELKPFLDFLNRARIVYDSENISHIAYHADDFNLIENLFINRSNYHMNVYQFSKVAGIEKQFRDICYLADSGGFKLLGYSITEIQRDCGKYCCLDDTLLNLIRNEKSDNPQIRKAQELIKHLDNGKFYELIFEAKNKDEIDRTYKKLNTKFGDIFCKVEKHIPNANIPKNIPLFDDDGNSVQKLSNLQLDYESTMIFCKAFDSIIFQNACNYLNNNDI